MNERYPDTALSLIEQDPPTDLLLDLTSTVCKPDLPESRETWTLSVDGFPAQALVPYVWCLLRGGPVCAVSVVATLPDGSRKTVDRSYSAVDWVSATRTRNPVLWKGTEMLTRSVRRAAVANGAATLLDNGSTAADGDCELRWPSAPQLAAWIVRALARIVRRRTQKAMGREAWFIGIRPAVALPTETRDRPDELLRRPIFRRLEQPYGLFRADPFPIEHAGRQYLFFEEFSYARSRGHIAVGEIDERGFVTDPYPCLVRDHHLSYPFVFEHDGVMHMVPESARNGTVDLYRARNFPREWVHERTLISGVAAIDPTLLQADGVWWLFANVFVPGASPNDELHLFSAPSLRDAWTPHPQNPIVSDVRCARPAGALFQFGGDWIRPAQDGSRGYGSRMTLRRVVALSPTTYLEEPVGILSPDWLPSARATHTYNRDARLEVTDGLIFVRNRRDARGRGR